LAKNSLSRFLPVALGFSRKIFVVFQLKITEELTGEDLICKPIYIQEAPVCGTGAKGWVFTSTPQQHLPEAKRIYKKDILNKLAIP
jgi:hypothetical protein